MLGDVVQTALTRLGITTDQVESWLGRPCGCSERKEKLNALHLWAKQAARLTQDRAREFLNRLLS